MAGLSKKDQQRVLDHVQAQGVTVTQTKKGYLMRMPDGKTTMMHKSESDHKGPMALRAQLRRSGITWPFDGVKADLPKYITDGTVRQATLDRYRLAITGAPDGQLPGEVFPQELVKAEHALRAPGEPMPKNPNFTNAYRVLYRLGYMPGGRYGTKSQGKAWVLKLEDVVAEPVLPAKPVAPARMFIEEPEVAPESPSTPETIPTENGRDFLDSVDSWTIDLEEVADVDVRTLAKVLHAAGLTLELRVWKP